jgi:hypothetical protein
MVNPYFQQPALQASPTTCNHDHFITCVPSPFLLPSSPSRIPPLLSSTAASLRLPLTSPPSSSLRPPIPRDLALGFAASSVNLSLLSRMALMYGVLIQLYMIYTQANLYSATAHQRLFPIGAPNSLTACAILPAPVTLVRLAVERAAL